MPVPIRNKNDIVPGELYGDCFFHPCICLGVVDGAVWGVSLVDGSYPRSCDLSGCGLVKLTPEEAWQWKKSGPPELPEGVNIPEEMRWW